MKKVTFHLEVGPFTPFVGYSVNKLCYILSFSITIFKEEWLVQM